MPWSLMLISLIALCNANTETALKGETCQSSVYSGVVNVTAHTSERAIDGENNTCSHTRFEINSWWSIDLLDVYRIDSINIYNEQSNSDTCANLSGAQIYIGNSREKGGTTNRLCKNITTFTLEKQNIFNCDTNMSGRYITVFSPKHKYLILCEVKIYGTKSPFELFKENKTWEEALDYCREQNMHLASIVDEETQTWAELKAKNSTTPFVWLGLRYTCTLEFWFWVEDLPLNFNRWAPDSKIDDCNISGAMDKQGNHWWFRKQATERYNFICAK